MFRYPAYDRHKSSISTKSKRSQDRCCNSEQEPMELSPYGDSANCQSCERSCARNLHRRGNSRLLGPFVLKLVRFRRRGRRDERHVVFLHGVVDGGEILREDLAPLDELRFEPLVEFDENGEFGGGGRGIGAVGEILQSAEFPIQLNRIVGEILR